VTERSSATRSEPVPDALVLTGGTSSAPVIRSAMSPPPMVEHPATNASAATIAEYPEAREIFFI
jgi:hypothetical protein